ncbi:TonB-dependent receptor [Lichenicola cladoniae]|uniref:TonB-dependent receptor n=1 Tax=Lichenicola cladoniae TaxID=1484109 RepID=A0A6M8HLK6_9PROT|nr:TonB-dependent receptor [Lichenicola cladoniae]NPD66039.1 TonB-dependent receptor [Acetobacteraceae bacterium]QKE89222.1 TonB-dependent receptor [Lichenicola cladoniae]
MKHKVVFRSSLLSTTIIAIACFGDPPVSVAAEMPVVKEGKAIASPDKRSTPKAVRTAESSEEVSVVGTAHQSSGGGLLALSNSTKSSVTSTRAYILTQPATANPVRLIQLQPGAVAATQDPYGVEPGNLTVRGLNTNQIIFLFDGSPITNDGGFNATEAVDALNLEEVKLSPGSTNFDLPGSNGAAGTISMLLHNPSHQLGGMVNFTYGTNNSRQSFVRLETGDLGKSGIRGFVSYSNFFGDDWRSPGKIKRQHIDAKFIKDWRNGSETSFSATWTNLNYQLERPPTLAQYAAQGQDFNYDANYSAKDTNYYKFHQNVNDNIFLTLENKIVVSRAITVNFTPYLFYAKGLPGPGASVLSTSSAYYGTQKIQGLQLHTSSGAPTSSTLLYSSVPTKYVRPGVNANVNIDLDNHNRLTLGDWYAFTELSQSGQFNYVDASGSPGSLWGSKGSAVRLPNGQLYATSNVVSRLQTNNIYLGDHANYFGGRLAIEGGLKYEIFRASSFNRLPGATYNVTNNQTAPMPSFGVRYNLDNRSQVFFDAGDNTRTPDPSQITDAISSSTGKKTTTASRDQKIENSIVEELGYRYNDQYLAAQVSLFNYNFTNRQISTVVVQNGTMVTQYINGGGQTSRGVDVSIGSKPWHHLSLFASGEFLQATIDNNIADGADYLATTGRTATGSPKWTGNISLSYDDNHLFGNVQFHYFDSQYSTFTNDERLPSYKTVDMSLGYRLPPVGPVKNPTVQLNMINLANTHYLTGIYANQLTARSAKGIFGSTLAGTLPTYIVGSGFAAMVSVSASL